MWKEITSQVNALGVCPRTETEVRNRWRNLSRGATEKFTAVQKERTQTGGGPPPAQPSQAEENIINCMRDTTSFRGVPGGHETAIVESEDQSEDTFQYNADEEMEAIWRRRLDIHFEGIDSPVPAAHVILPATQTSTPVATVIQQEQNRTDMNARSSGNEPPQKKLKKKTAEDVYTLQCQVLERELVKTNLQIQLYERLHSKLDDNLAAGLLSLIEQ